MACELPRQGKPDFTTLSPHLQPFDTVRFDCSAQASYSIHIQSTPSKVSIPILIAIMGWFGDGKSQRSFPHSIDVAHPLSLKSCTNGPRPRLDSSQADASQQFQNSDPDNKASFTHELIAGAASYEAAKAYENHCNANGRSITSPSPPLWSSTTITQ